MNKGGQILGNNRHNHPYTRFKFENADHQCGFTRRFSCLPSHYLRGQANQWRLRQVCKINSNQTFFPIIRNCGLSLSGIFNPSPRARRKAGALVSGNFDQTLKYQGAHCGLESWSLKALFSICPNESNRQGKKSQVQEQPNPRLTLSSKEKGENLPLTGLKFFPVKWWRISFHSM